MEVPKLAGVVHDYDLPDSTQLPPEYGDVWLPFNAHTSSILEAMQLVAIDNHGHKLEVAAAAAFIRMKEAAEKAGHTVRVSTAYRSNGEQTLLYARYTDAKARGENPTPVAKPGTSNHERGTAVDLYVAAYPAFLAWLRTHAKEFDFYETVAREPWHYDYKPRQA